MLWYEMERNLVETLKCYEDWPIALGEQNIYRTWDGRGQPYRELPDGTVEFTPKSLFPFISLQATSIWDVGGDTEPTRTSLKVDLDCAIGANMTDETSRKTLDELCFWFNCTLRTQRKLTPQVSGVDLIQFFPGDLVTLFMPDGQVAGWVARFNLTLVGQQIGG